MSHTPGPWNYCGEDDGDFVVFGGKNEGVFICNVGFDRVVPANSITVAFDVDHANALLIAAAPELLEALRRMVDRCTRYLEEVPISESEMFDPNYVGPLTQARAAIAKAEGEVHNG